jgi:hypothetical protein
VFLVSRQAELSDRLALPEAVLSRTDLALLGWQRRAVDAIFRECARREGVVILPGYRRPMVRVAVYRKVIEGSTYGNDRVWPT